MGTVARKAATPKRKSKVYTISLPREMAEQAEMLARNESRTMSEVFRESLRAYQRERSLKALEEAAAYGATRNPHGYTEEDVVRITKEIRAEMRAERKGRSRIAG